MVLVSLLDNAVKFTEEGHIRVSCEEDKSRHVLRFVRPDAYTGILYHEAQYMSGLILLAGNAYMTLSLIHI